MNGGGLAEFGRFVAWLVLTSDWIFIGGEVFGSAPGRKVGFFLHFDMFAGCEMSADGQSEKFYLRSEGSVWEVHRVGLLVVGPTAVLRVAMLTDRLLSLQRKNCR